MEIPGNAAAIQQNELEILSTTESVCPKCLKRISANRVLIDGNVYLEKVCPEHGQFRTVVWRGEPGFSTWVRPKIPAQLKNPFTEVTQGCPFDCGLCSAHRQEPCCVLLDVTKRCDLACAFCFASAGTHDATEDPSVHEIRGWYQRLLDAGGPFNIQLSGGEPSIRDDLPEVIAAGKEMGFTFFQLNTNGLRIARDKGYLQALKDAGLCTVYLQFDGTNDAIYQKMRGARIFAQKIWAVENCAEVGLGVVLVPTLVPGINTEEIGSIIRFGIEHSPTVRGVHFQPVSYFGRYPQAPKDEDRITIPEVIRAVEAQMDGRIRKESFIPPGGENAHCSFHANFIIMPDGELKPLTQHNTSQCCCTTPERAEDGARKSRLVTARHWSAPRAEFSSGKKQVLGEWDKLLERATKYKFSISGMAFQDAWNLDLERLRDCYIIHVSAEGKMIPFCAYNLTDSDGIPLYRPL